MKPVIGLRRAGVVLSFAIIVQSSPALATWSIVAADTARKEVAAAAASCVGFEITDSYGSAPGRGVVVGLAYAFHPGRDKAVAVLKQGGSASSALAGAIAPDLDDETPLRQYGIVDTSGDSATFIGSSVDPLTGGQTGHGGRFPYVVHGNFLTSDRVLSQAENSVRTEGCDLADRLMTALEAGANGDEGDARCRRKYGIAATTAFLYVDRADGSDPVRLSVLVQNGESAIAHLRREYDAWRAAHACAGACSGCAGGCSTARCLHGSGAAVAVLSATIVFAVCSLGRRWRPRRPL